MSTISLNIAERLLAAQVAIDGVAADSEIQAVLNLYGYDVAEMTAAKTLYEQAQTLTNAQKTEYGEQHEATENFLKAWEVANAAYMRSLQLARVALKKNAKAQTSLGLMGDRLRSFSGWAGQALLFYDGLLENPDLLAQMSQFGYDTAEVQAELALVKAAHAANTTQEKEKGEAEDATIARDTAMDELDEWMSDFRAVSKIALANVGQKYEALGLGIVP